MKYIDGTLVRIGDRITVAGHTGVYIIDEVWNDNRIKASCLCVCGGNLILSEGMFEKTLGDAKTFASDSYSPIEIGKKTIVLGGDGDKDITLVLNTKAQSISLRGRLAESEFSSKNYVCMFDRLNKKMALKLARPDEAYAFGIVMGQQGYVKKSRAIAKEVKNVSIKEPVFSDIKTIHYDGLRAYADDGSPVWVFDLTKGKVCQ